MQIGHGRQPFRAEELEERRPVLRRLGLAHIRAELGPRHAAAGPERFQERGHRPDDPDSELGQRRHGGEAVRIREHGVVAGREEVAARLGRAGGVLHLEEPAHSLLLQPLADVALLRPGLDRQLRRRRAPQAPETAVEAEPVADVDGSEVHEAERRLHQAAGERVPPRGLVRRFRGWHGLTSPRV